MEGSKSWSAKAVAAAMLAALVLLSQPMAWALTAGESADQSASQSEDDYWAGAGHKLVRGLANAGTGWMEAFRQPIVQSEKGGFWGGVAGFFIGLGAVGARTIVGAYDFVTFAVPAPEKFQPLMQPEFVWQPEPGER